MGAKKRAYYRIVAADSRFPRDGRFLETVGTYNPITKPAEVNLVEEKLGRWLDQGAIPSQTVSSLLTQVGYTEKYLKAKKGENVSEISVRTTIKERPKKTRKMKKAVLAQAKAEEAAKDEAAKAAAAAAKAAEEAKAAEKAAADAGEAEASSE
jgi:small subunit ribosomal protein S16